MQEITHTPTSKGGSFNYEMDGKKLGEIVYIRSGENRIIIDHTEVDDSLRGQGVGKQLLAKLVDHVREHNLKAIPLCPYANATLQKTKEWQDIIAE